MFIALWIICGILVYGSTLAQLHSVTPEELWNEESAGNVAILISIIFGVLGFWMLFVTLGFMLFAHLFDGNKIHKYQGFRWWK